MAMIALATGWISATAPSEDNYTWYQASRTLSASDIIAGGGGNEGTFEVTVTSEGDESIAYPYEVRKNGYIVHQGEKTSTDDPISLNVTGQQGDVILIKILSYPYKPRRGKEAQDGSGTITFGP
jgi:hypothetical protein